ncbi:HI1506-related protein [Pseudomonas sp. P9_31]|uniref:HI1506-related protein n=1 Tax=Pseudomonas sp. P9_31 TaxID=3043448 RepID=UPI002A368FCB|nr:HI1506-related protein [Pseudomonas sp. P9_31]WPN56689.1 HI1506-related protein [Pseudomonas sp. P9_31]
MTIVITSKHDGFRRCGIAHSSTAERYPDDFFSEAQLRALAKEPQLILAYEEDEFDQVQDSRDENLQEVDLSKASDTAQNAQSQAPEAGTPTLGDAVVLPVAPLVGNSEPGSNGSGLAPSTPVIAPDKEQPKEAGTDSDDALWEEAHQEELAREAAKAQAAKPPAKPSKPKATKAEDEGK